MKSKTVIFGLLCTTLVLMGCSDKNRETKEKTTYERQQEALRDPFGYSPQVEKTDISGGDLGNFDKDAFGKDVDSVFNP
jgi:hypothetical protein